ncbi:hypothetical protein ANCCAN_20090 [Ancylostoma caninum]|uniref:Uncharacterized protein n=1 Tax=Ancylostoma caninum TaxID=29170 RepID=A0A368FST6_ANCCA|nr:hypothetical protein ANCCAN_20090 [Ancylostoma caninum]
MYIQHFGLSNEEISRMEELMAVLYGAPPPISYHGHVESLYQEILHDYDNHRYFFCSSCSESMAESRNACDNEECSIRGQNIKRAKKMQRIEVQVISSIPQLSDVLVRDIEKIIEMHARLHRREQNHERNDVRLFDGYYQNIETRDAFENNHLRVLLSLSIDGFRPRRLSKREIWPLYLRIDCLPQNEANNYYNSILAGTIQSRMKPTEKVLETLFSRLESELHDLRDSPIEIDVGGTSWLVEVKLYKGVADMAVRGNFSVCFNDTAGNINRECTQAQQVLFGVPRWNAEYGCSKCYIKGTRIQNSRIWIPGSDADTVLRSRESYIEDAELGQYGISKITSAMRLLPPCEFLADALHVCSEGITRDRMRDLFSSKTKFPGLRVSRESVEKVKQSLLGISNHTYANSLILSLDDMKTCKAAEVDELAFVVFPLVVAVGIVPCPIAATALLGYWMCIKIISKSLTLTVSSIETVKLIAQHTREISIIEAPEIFTMKCHWFFDHAMEEEITNFGTAYQWSSCPFESHHRRLQIRVNQSTTNSASVIIEKYLLSKRVRTLFHAQCANGNESMLALKEKVDNNHRKRFPVDIKISESIYIPKNSRVNSSELREPEKTRILRSGEEPYSRIVVRGKVFSSRLYWTRTKSSRQDLIYLDGDDGNESFGSALLFLYNHNMSRPPLYTLGRGPTPPRQKLQATRRAEVASPVVNRRLFFERSQNPIVPAEEIPIEMEEEAPTGDIYERREFNFDAPPAREAPRPAGSLYDCITNGTIQMDKAAKLIMDQKKRRVFNKAAYEEFTRSEVATRAQHYDFDGLDDTDESIREVRLFVFATKLQSDILRAQLSKLHRSMEFTEKFTVPASRPKVSINNCSKKSWILEAEPPFVKVELKSIGAQWQPRKKDNTFLQLTSFFRFILTRITNPPHKIREFAVRVNGSGGRDVNLQNLPHYVEKTLKDFGEDVIGLGHAELEAGVELDWEQSSFYLSLGADESERAVNLTTLTKQKVEWATHIFHSLQKALRDVRAYGYNEEQGTWLPSNVGFYSVQKFHRLD